MTEHVCSEYISKAECAMCQSRNTSERQRIGEQITGLRREVYILLGTTTATIIIGALNLLINLR